MPPKYKQVIASKMKKTKVYQRSSYTKPFIPETVFLSEDNLEYMLNNYPKVVFKPNIGERGMYVGSISRTSFYSLYRIHYLTEFYNNLSVEEVFSFIKQLAPKKRFILQKGIDLIEYDNKPVDIRVVVQKPYKKWLVTGYIARIAADNKMVTNLDSGGKGMPFKEFIDNTNFSKPQVAQLKKTMRLVAKKIAICLNKQYPNIRELGVDFGVDKALYPWVLEVNTSPGYWRFKYFKNKKLYNRLIKYHNIIASSNRYQEIPRMIL